MVTLSKKKDKPPTNLEGEDGRCIFAADGKEANLMVTTALKENDETTRVEAESTNECTTPTGKEYRIPEPLKCPPAPKAKKKRKVSSSSSNVDDKVCKECVALPELEAVLAPLNHTSSSSKIAWSSASKKRR